MALESGGMVDAQRAAQIVAAAVQSDWDRDFTSNDKIKGWLLEQVQRVPFDPTRVTLLEYVKSRMQAAEAQQKQQAQQTQASAQSGQAQQHAQPQYGQHPNTYQQQQQQQPYAQQHQNAQQPQRNSASNPAPDTSFSQQASTSKATTSSNNTASYTVLSDDDSSGNEMEDDNQQYEFGLDDLGDTNKTSNAFFAESRSPSPLPPPLAQRQQQQPYAHSQPSASSSTSNSSLFPYSTGHPQQALPQSQPFLQARPTSTPATQTHYSHAALPISQPVTLNPALLFNHQTNQARPQQQLQPQVIAPHQLSQPQPSSYQVNGITVTPTPSTSTATPAQNTASSASATPAPNGKTKRRTEFEVVVPQRREGSAPSSAKRKKTESTGDAARQPLSATKPKAGSSTATTTSAATSDQAPLQSILSVTPNTPQPPTQDQQEWNEIRKEMERTLHQATRSPHKTVMKMFKLLAPFVSEPPDATSRQGSREAFITDLRLPAEARLAILDVIKDETSDDFDVIFVVDPRATILLYEWTKDLALVAKGKYTGPESAEEIKKTSRSLLADLYTRMCLPLPH
ncbi:hypothetical protein P389DRAFT_58021 [Cystobasidium minutum MCA 4210]|uniref:uncharacterized protein n=1 Tax=Cystobasidium minutum MCA 4210 TaxID=1397322 RepID=UPI0034CDE2CB|eukprot:jgi/Rhomi1/58021/CE58020_658